MTKYFEYKEVVYDPQKSFIEQLNEEGKNGWEFCTQAQRFERTVDFKTGQPKVIIITIFKKKVISTKAQC